MEIDEGVHYKIPERIICMSLLLTKAELLAKLQFEVYFFKIPELLYFTVEQFLNEDSNKLSEIMQRFCCPVIVRSSCIDEDGTKESSAGKYVSVLNIDPSNKRKLSKAICEVIDSYSANEFQKNQVIIQAMVQDSTMSGVILTKA